MPAALITGATSGIGAAFARVLAAQGTDVILVARDTNRLAEAAAEISGRFSVSADLLAADLADRRDVDRVAARLADEDRPIDLLVNNAGFANRVPLTGEDLTLHDLAIDVMIRAVLVLGGVAGRAMRRRGSGCIINVSSTSGFMALGNYSAIKAWVTTYSESLAVELAGTGVSVTALCPGWVRTEFHERGAIDTRMIPSWLWLDPETTVRRGLADAERGRVISIPSRRYQALMLMVRHGLPRATVRAVSKRMSSSRR
jgi:uncharacterized protein